MPVKQKKSPSKKSSKTLRKITFQERLEHFSATMTEWLGSNASLLIHSLFFAGSFGLVYFGVPMDRVLLVLTTAVSLEAIYMAIFIQMAVNKNTKSLQEVEKDIDEIQEDVEEIQEDVEEIQEDVDSIEKDVDKIEKDVDELQEDVEEIQENVEEDIEEETEEEKRERGRDERIDRVVGSLDLIQRQLDVLFEEMKKAKTKK